MKKLLLMGRSGAGKTSMHSIIFANYPPNETVGIGFTVDIEESKIRFLGKNIYKMPKIYQFLIYKYNIQF